MLVCGRSLEGVRARRHCTTVAFSKLANCSVGLKRTATPTAGREVTFLLLWMYFNFFTWKEMKTHKYLIVFCSSLFDCGQTSRL